MQNDIIHDEGSGDQRVDGSRCHDTHRCYMFPFDLEKTCQAAGRLLSHEPTKRMNYVKLIKLLYVADREGLRDAGEPITGDEPVAMDNGPALSIVFDMVKSDSERIPTERQEWRNIWQTFFVTDGADAVLCNDPGDDALCEGEEVALDHIWERYKDQTWKQMVDGELHFYQEWIRRQPQKGSSNAIYLRDILEAVGLTGEASDIEADAREANRLVKLMGT